ncbi:hypothetical protein KAR48_09365 [bacterium]|nr:hypothetical protein [bacterium]
MRNLFSFLLFLLFIAGCSNPIQHETETIDYQYVEQIDLDVMHTRHLSVSPDGMQILHTGPAQKHEFYWHDKKLGNRTLIGHFLTVGNINSITPSPSGRHILFRKHNRACYIADLLTNELDSLAFDHGYDYCYPYSWSPDGSKVVFFGYHGYNQKELFVLHMDTFQKQIFTSPFGFYDISWSDDSQSILYTFRKNDTKIFHIDLKTEICSQLVDGDNSFKDFYLCLDDTAIVYQKQSRLFDSVHLYSIRSKTTRTLVDSMDYIGRLFKIAGKNTVCFEGRHDSHHDNGVYFFDLVKEKLTYEEEWPYEYRYRQFIESFDGISHIEYFVHSENTQILMSSLNGGAVNVQLTDGSFEDYYPRWSNSNQYLSFLRDNRLSFYNLVDKSIYQTAHVNVAQWTDHPYYPATIYSDKQGKMFLFDIVKQERVHLNDSDYPYLTQPCFSPDGKQLICLDDSRRMLLFSFGAYKKSLEFILSFNGVFKEISWCRAQGDKVSFVYAVYEKYWHGYEIWVYDPETWEKFVVAERLYDPVVTWDYDGKSLLYMDQSKLYRRSIIAEF